MPEIDFKIIDYEKNKIDVNKSLKEYAIQDAAIGSKIKTDRDTYLKLGNNKFFSLNTNQVFNSEVVFNCDTNAITANQ